MLHRVVVPFQCSWDGITSIPLAVGEVKDFGSMAAGLVAAGWIVPDETNEAVEEFAVADEAPIEMAVVRRKRRR